MYITLYNNDMTTNILVMNFLRSKMVEFIFQNNFYIMKKDDYDNIQGSYQDILLQNMDCVDAQIKYYMLSNDIPFTYKKVETIFEGYSVSEDFLLSETFVIPKSRTTYGSLFVGLYFEGPLILQPASIIWQIIHLLSFREPYYSIFSNFIPLKNKVIYELVFNLSGNNFSKKFEEIHTTKQKILNNSFLISLEEVILGEIYNFFQTKFLENKTNKAKIKLNFLDSVVYLPEMDKNLQSLKDLIKN